MTRRELEHAVVYDRAALRLIVDELGALLDEVAVRPPTLRERTAAGAFLAQFYTGLENILKRLAQYHRLPLPKGAMWHLELFELFCAPPTPPAGVLFNEVLRRELGPYRRFRHVVHHGYGFDLDWERIAEGIEQVRSVLDRFESSLDAYLVRLE